MSVLTEGKHTGEFLLSEGNGFISRDEIVIAAAAGAMNPGQVLGKITASGKYTAYNNAASDGTEVAAGILYAGVADKTADQPGVAISRLAEVRKADLTGLDAAGEADLLARHILCRV